VLVRVFVRPEGDRLRVAVRAPLEAMRDVGFPLRGPGYLDLDAAAPALEDAARRWIVGSLVVFEDGSPVGPPRLAAVRVTLPSDRSFGSYDDALRHLAAPPLPAETDLIWQQALLDVLLEYPIRSARSQFAIEPGFARLGVRTTTVLRFQAPEKPERAYQYDGDPGLVRLDPRWYHAALPFARLGLVHILDGVDHLLFVLGLVIPFRKLRPLVALVTSFTVAHSLTLAASALGYAPSALWFPPLVETLIALSILYMAFENIVGPRWQRRWIIAFAFGLVHGFGFSFQLRESLQFAGGQLATALVSFNLGVEIGQVLVLVLALPVLTWLFRHTVPERIGIILLSALVAHTAWHWMLERGADLRQYRFTWPALSLDLLADLLRGLVVILVLVAVVWGLSVVFGRLVRVGGDSQAPAQGAVIES
jgi:hypothetical protein